MWRSEDNLREAVFSYHVSFQSWTQAVRLGEKDLYSLNLILKNYCLFIDMYVYIDMLWYLTSA